MPNFNLTVNYRRPFAPPLGNVLTGNATPTINDWVRRFVSAVDTGNIEADFIQAGWADDVAVGSNAYATPAMAMLVLSGGAGAVGGTLAGTLVTTTWATSDTASCTALAAAIRANTSVNRIVTASTREMRVTLASVVAGTTVRICGQVFTAVATAANIVAFGDFNIDGTDTQDATALALAINRHPSLAGRVIAVGNVGAVHIFLVEDRPPVAFECITNPSAATITVNVATPTAGTRVAVIAAVPGPIGNEVRATASGTGMTIVTGGSAGLLGGGTGGVTPTTTWRGVP